MSNHMVVPETTIMGATDKPVFEACPCLTRDKHGQTSPPQAGKFVRGTRLEAYA